MDRPRARSVDPVAVDTPDGEMWFLKDPAGLAGEVAVTRIGLFLYALMNGRRELSDIQAEFARATGEILPLADLEALIAQLDAQYLLDSPRFQAHAAAIDADFLAHRVRPSQFGGRCYPADPAGARAQLDAYFTHPDGPSTPAPTAPVSALVAPHIDPPRGGPAYAHAYHALTGPPPELVIVLGTSHVPTGTIFTFTRKDFETPLGIVPTDAHAIDRLEARFGRSLYTGEIRHRGEHSIEFQMMFLRHRWPDAPLTALPVLCGLPAEDLLAGRLPETSGECAAQLDLLAEIAAERRTLIVASADLAHVGPQFGDELPYEDAERAALEGEDRAMLDFVLAGDRRGFARQVWDQQDKNRICGFMPIYATMALLERRAAKTSGKLLAYRQWPDPRAVVTFTSIAFS